MRCTGMPISRAASSCWATALMPRPYRVLDRKIPSATSIVIATPAITSECQLTLTPSISPRRPAITGGTALLRAP